MINIPPHQKRYKGLDCIKVLLAMVVVAIHTTDWSLLGLTHIAVPYFFLVSGFLLFGKWNGEKEHDLQITWTWTLQTVKLYLIWTAVYLPYTIYGFIHQGLLVHKAIAIFFWNLLFVGENYLSWPLWYLLAMIYVGTIIWVMQKINVPLWGMLLAGIVLFICAQSHAFASINPVQSAFQHISHGRLGPPLLYITTGALLSKMKSRLSIWSWGFLGIGFLALQHYSAWFYPFTAVSMFMFARSLELNCMSDTLSRFLTRISRTMYLSHMFFAGFFILSFSWKENDGIRLWGCTVALCVFASFLSDIILTKKQKTVVV